MKKLVLSTLLLVCATLVGCAQSPQTLTSPQSQSVQPETAGSDRGGMH